MAVLQGLPAHADQSDLESKCRTRRPGRDRMSDLLCEAKMPQTKERVPSSS